MNRSLALLGIVLAAPCPTLAAPNAEVASGAIAPDLPYPQAGERAPGCGGAGGGGATAEGLGGREDGIRAVGGGPILLCALDRWTIDEVIQRQMNALRYCYQRELSRNPKLAGKVVVKFTIADDGTVSQAEINSTTMNNEAVEDCLVDRFLRMQFIVPADRGLIIVTYPFTFRVGE